MTVSREAAPVRMKGSRSSRARRSGSSCFQRVRGPIPMRKARKGVTATNMVLNQGKPTEILPQAMAS